MRQYKSIWIIIALFVLAKKIYAFDLFIWSYDGIDNNDATFDPATYPNEQQQYNKIGQQTASQEGKRIYFIWLTSFIGNFIYYAVAIIKTSNKLCNTKKNMHIHTFNLHPFVHFGCRLWALPNLFGVFGTLGTIYDFCLLLFLLSSSINIIAFVMKCFRLSKRKLPKTCFHLALV